MRTKPHNISAAIKPDAAHTLKSASILSAPIPVRRPSRILTPDSSLLTPLFPLTPILNKRTQFYTPKHDLNPRLKTSYIIYLSPRPENTNPIHPAPQPLGRPLEPNPVQTHTEPQPNPFRTHPHALHPAHLTPLHPHPANLPPQNRSKSAQKLQKTAQNPFETAKNRSKRAQNASKTTLILPSPCANPPTF